MRRLLWVNLETSSFDNRRTQKACSFPSYDYFVPELGKCEPPHHIFSWSWDICFTPTCYQSYRRVSISWLRTSSEPISWLPLSRTTPHRLSGKKNNTRTCGKGYSTFLLGSLNRRQLRLPPGAAAPRTAAAPGPAPTPGPRPWARLCPALLPGPALLQPAFLSTCGRE